MKNLLCILIKSITFFLVTLIIFQSCVSFHSVTIDQAIATEKRVRIKTTEGEKYTYKKLIEKDGIVYGVKRISGFGLVELDISQLVIIEVKYSYPGATAALVFVSFFAVLFIYVSIEFAINGLY